VVYSDIGVVGVNDFHILKYLIFSWLFFGCSLVRDEGEQNGSNKEDRVYAKHAKEGNIGFGLLNQKSGE